MCVFIDKNENIFCCKYKNFRLIDGILFVVHVLFQAIVLVCLKNAPVLSTFFFNFAFQLSHL